MQVSLHCGTGVAVGEGLGVAVGDGETLGLGVAVGVGVGDDNGVGVGVALGVGDGDAPGGGVGVGDGVPDGVGVGEGKVMVKEYWHSGTGLPSIALGSACGTVGATGPCCLNLNAIKIAKTAKSSVTNPSPI